LLCHEEFAGRLAWSSRKRGVEKFASPHQTPACRGLITFDLPEAGKPAVAVTWSVIFAR
jgi:hypothetical protein